MDLYKDLFEIFMASESLGDFTRKIAIEIDNPIILINKNYQVLSYSDDFAEHDAFYNETIARGYWSLRFSKYVNDLFKDEAPYHIITGFGSYRRLIVRLSYRKHFVGYAVIIEQNKNLDELIENVPDLLEAFSRLIAKNIALSENVTVDQGDETFLMNLLNGEFRDRELFLKRLSETKIRLNDHSEFLVIDVTPLKERDLEAFLAKMHELCPNAVFFYRNHLLILFLNDGFEEVILQSYNDALFRYRINSILSSSIVDLYSIVPRFQLLLSLFEYLKKVKNEYALYKEEDYKYLLPYISVPKNVLMGFVNDKIRGIYRYDLENKTDYLHTLYVYLAVDRSLRESSKILYLHKNTVSYRINKLTEDFDLLLENPNSKILYLNSIVLLYYLFDKIDKVAI